jgi:hypothetical protein
MLGVPLAIVNVAVWLLVPAALVAVSTAFVKVPAAVGVPLITPFVATESPPGRSVPENAIGSEPLAVMVLLNATPTVPEKALVLVIVGAVEGAVVATRTSVNPIIRDEPEPVPRSDTHVIVI